METVIRGVRRKNHQRSLLLSLGLILNACGDIGSSDSNSTSNVDNSIDNGIQDCFQECERVNDQTLALSTICNDETVVGPDFFAVNNNSTVPDACLPLVPTEEEEDTDIIPTL